MSGNGKPEEDFVSPRWRKYSKEAPMIPIGNNIASRSDKDKFIYFHKLASSLNHAAQEIQKERDLLNKICFAKEKQIESLLEEKKKNVSMIHTQLAIKDKEKQELLEENQSLRKEIKNLENRLGNNN
jgi:septal ring factor EnvC (AmiA/AmiB activator)